MPRELLAALGKQGVTVPFPIQAATLPNSLAYRDVLGRGRTGSGKTLAFGLALLARTAGQRAEPRQPLGLILVPTRELAQQVTDALTPYARSVKLRLATVVGGMSIGRQANALRGGAEVVVATPGRLKDLIDRGDCLTEPGLRHRPRRGRPDGRHGLHAAGHRPSRPGPPRRPAHAVLRDPRPQRRPARTPLPDRPRRALRRPLGRRRHDDGTPRTPRHTAPTSMPPRPRSRPATAA